MGHEAEGYRKENESIVDEGYNGCRCDIVLQGCIEAIISGTDIDSGNPSSDRNTSPKDGEPHKGEETNYIFVVIENGSNAEEKKE